MTKSAYSNWARVLKRIIIYFFLILFILWSGHKTPIHATRPYKQYSIPVRDIYDSETIKPSLKKVIIEIQDTGPELPFLYITAGFENEWINSMGKNPNDFFKRLNMQNQRYLNYEYIGHIKTREELRIKNVLLFKYDLKRILEKKFPNAKVIMTFIPISERIEDAQRWPDSINPIYTPAVCNPEIQFADIIVQLDFRQAIAMLYTEFTEKGIREWPVKNGYGSYGAYFDVTLNVFTPVSKIVQFSTDYSGLKAEKKLQAYNDYFNEPVPSDVINQILKKKKSKAWVKRYKFDRVFYKNFPDDNIYWNFRAEEEARLNKANRFQPPKRISYYTNTKVIKNYTRDFNTSPLYPLYLWTSDSVEAILDESDWQTQRVKRIREWARTYESNENFLDKGSESNDAFNRRMHQLMDVEIKSFIKVEKDRLIDPVLGELGDSARKRLLAQDKLRLKRDTENLLGAGGGDFPTGIW